MPIELINCAREQGYAMQYLHSKKAVNSPGDQSIRIRILVPLGFALLTLAVLSVSGFYLHNRGRLEQ